MLCSSTAGFGSFQGKAKEVCFAFVALAGGQNGTRQEEAPLLYFFSLLVLCKKPSNSILLICKRILFWLCRRTRLSVQTDHQTDWRLVSVFFSFHESPAVISISLSVLLCCGSGGMGERLLSCPHSKAGLTHLLLTQAYSHQAT